MGIARVSSWLLILADPAGHRADMNSDLPKPLSAAELGRLVELAAHHGVLPATLTNLEALAAQAGPAQVVAASSSEAASQALEQATARASQRLVELTGFCMLLRRQLQEVAARLEAAAIPAMVIKGPQFADRLYGRPALRTFTDIDLLVPPAAVEPAEQVMRELGYTPRVEAGRKHAGGYGERTWRREGQRGGSVEIHWNLVNSPAVQRGVSVEFSDLQLEQPCLATGLARPSSASLLLMAAVHGAASHQFDRLQPLVDVCQAARGAAGPIDEAWLAGAARRTGGSLSLVTALMLAGRMFRESACGELLSLLDLPLPGPLVRRLLTPAVVVGGKTAAGQVRRQLFRELLKNR